MYKNKFKYIIFVLIFALIIPNVAMAEGETNKEKKADLVFFLEILDYIKANYPFEIEEDKLIEGALKGMLQSVDDYSDYYTAEEANAMYSGLLGTFSGIGVHIKEKDGYILITNTMKGQPAEKAGIKKDDIIVSVDGKDVKELGLEKASALIKGQVGTKVKIKVKRNDEFLSFEVTRDMIKVNPVSYKILDNKIGYIKLDEFNSFATIETKKALTEFDNKSVKKVILDLRDNPGGLLSQAIGMSSLFVTKGPVVHIREKGKELETHSSTLEKSKYKLVVLVNENSASASEIFAGAIKDRKAGTLVGSKTFGKGIVQSLNFIGGGSMVKLTTSEYLTPNKISIHGKGIEPDIIVKNTEKEDLQLKKAIELLK